MEALHLSSVLEACKHYRSPVVALEMIWRSKGSQTIGRVTRELQKKARTAKYWSQQVKLNRLTPYGITQRNC